MAKKMSRLTGWDEFVDEMSAKTEEEQRIAQATRMQERAAKEQREANEAARPTGAQGLVQSVTQAELIGSAVGSQVESAHAKEVVDEQADEQVDESEPEATQDVSLSEPEDPGRLDPAPSPTLGNDRALSQDQSSQQLDAEDESIVVERQRAEREAIAAASSMRSRPVAEITSQPGM